MPSSMYSFEQFVEFRQCMSRTTLLAFNHTGFQRCPSCPLVEILAWQSVLFLDQTLHKVLLQHDRQLRQYESTQIRTWTPQIYQWTTQTAFVCGWGISFILLPSHVCRWRVLCFPNAGNAEDMYTSEGTGKRRSPSPLLVRLTNHILRSMGCDVFHLRSQGPVL